MSGLVAIHRPDGRPVSRRDIARALGSFRPHGPAGGEIWCEGPVGLAGPAIARAVFPGPTTVAVALAGRLDNRTEMARLLEVESGDAAVVLAAYLRFGEGCVRRLVGELALAVWDGRRRRLLGARDALGSRTLYHRSSPGQLAIASEWRALRALGGPVTPNDDRIADFLVPPLEAADLTSTFHREIHRLPAAHLIVEQDGRVSIERYWSPIEAPEIDATSDAEWVERFRVELGRAVRCRIAGAAGAMLSGGVDSSAIVGFGARERRLRGGAPLRTFSVVGDDASRCVETRAIESVLGGPGLDAVRIRDRDVDGLLPEVDAILARLDEPFDATMIVPILVYAMARRAGLGAVLDGVDGDVVASLEPSFLGVVLRDGDWRNAWGEAGAMAAFYSGTYAPWSSRLPLLLGAVRAAWAPNALKVAWRGLTHDRRIAARLDETILTRDPGCRSRAAERLAGLWSGTGAARPRNAREYHAVQIDHPFLAVAVERYDRVARAASIEARHPFLDRRLVDLALALPWRTKLRDGWTKWVVREACRGLVPDDVRWRRGRWDRLGPLFLQGIIRRRTDEMDQLVREGRDDLAPYVDLARLDRAWERLRASRDAAAGEQVWSAARLAHWLRRERRSTDEEDRSMTDEKDGTHCGSKKPYRTPALTEYGALKDLTAGGSGSANEGSQGQRPRP